MTTKETLLSENELVNSLFMRRGTLPIVLTVPHDGWLEKIGKTQLLKDSILSPGSRDMAARVVARDIYVYALRKIGQTPSLAICLVKRQYQSIQTQRHFESTAVNLIMEAKEHRPDRRTLLIDLHGFKEQPDIREYDLIFGTDHRRSVSGSNIDIELAEFMTNRGYSVYLPTEEIKEAERYGAGGERDADKITPLVQEIIAAEIPGVDAVQIEIADRFRQRGTEREGKKLSQDLGDFLVHYGLNKAIAPFGC